MVNYTNEKSDITKPTVQDIQSPGLTTNKSEYIETAKARHELFIHQPYEQYSLCNHQAWSQLYARMLPYWHRYANEHFLKGIENLCLDHEHVPRLDNVNRFLSPLTGFKAVPVSGYVPAYTFFNCLRNREFPTTITIRDHKNLDYLPEPDIFHDIAGHVPMHTDPAFADALVRFGDCANTAIELVAELKNESERVRRLSSIVRAMARFFWFTIEFGLMQTATGVKAYGSGLLSSHGELKHAIVSPEVQRYPLQIGWVINQSFEIDHYQPLLFTADSFAHLFDLVSALEHWMKEGKLNNIAPGEPVISKSDIVSFLNAQR